MVIFLFLKEKVDVLQKKFGCKNMICFLITGVILCDLIFVNSKEIYFAGFGQNLIYFQNENLDMYSGSYALIDGDTKRVLAGKKETSPMANASTTKILTCIVTLENCSLDETAIVSANAAGQPKVHLGMKEGEEYPLKDMLYGLMLESYNDCAVVIAEHVAGSVEAFAEMMNQKAAEIGCQDTYFITPNGLDSENETDFHHTTASDLCRIMAYCTWESPKKELFLEITQTPSYSGTANGSTYSFTNHNTFLNQMDGVLSGKTGFTNKAGYCYVAALEQDGERYCIALLACGWPSNKNYKWHDAKVLFTYGLENYENRVMELEPIKEHILINGSVGKTSFEDLNQTLSLEIGAEGRTYEMLLKQEESLQAKVLLYTDTELPVEKGQQLGECRIYLGDMLIDNIPLKAMENSDVWNIVEIMKLIFSKFVIFLT